MTSILGYSGRHIVWKIVSTGLPRSFWARPS